MSRDEYETLKLRNSVLRNSLFFAPLRDLCGFAVNPSIQGTAKCMKSKKPTKDRYSLVFKPPSAGFRPSENPSSETPSSFAPLRDLCDFAVNSPIQETHETSQNQRSRLKIGTP